MGVDARRALGSRAQDAGFGAAFEVERMDATLGRAGATEVEAGCDRVAEDGVADVGSGVRLVTNAEDGAQPLRGFEGEASPEPADPVVGVANRAYTGSEGAFEHIEGGHGNSLIWLDGPLLYQKIMQYHKK